MGGWRNEGTDRVPVPMRTQCCDLAKELTSVHCPGLELDQEMCTGSRWKKKMGSCMLGKGPSCTSTLSYIIYQD